MGVAFFGEVNKAAIRTGGFEFAQIYVIAQSKDSVSYHSISPLLPPLLVESTPPQQ